MRSPRECCPNPLALGPDRAQLRCALVRTAALADHKFGRSLAQRHGDRGSRGLDLLGRILARIPPAMRADHPRCDPVHVALGHRHANLSPPVRLGWQERARGRERERRRPDPVPGRICEVVGVGKLVERGRCPWPGVLHATGAPALDIGPVVGQADRGPVWDKRGIESAQTDHGLMPNRSRDDAPFVVNDAPPYRAREVGSRRLREVRHHIGHQRTRRAWAQDGIPSCRHRRGKARGVNAVGGTERHMVTGDHRCEQRRCIRFARPDACGQRSREECPVGRALPRKQQRVIDSERGAREGSPHPCGLPRQEHLDTCPRLLRLHPCRRGGVWWPIIRVGCREQQG